MGEIIDLTSKVEFDSEAIKNKGISISGLYCSMEFSIRKEFYVKCNGEISGKELEDIVVKCVCHDEKGRVLGVDSATFFCNSITGYDIFSLEIRTDIRVNSCKLFILKG
jgi:hypothetical protein